MYYIHEGKPRKVWTKEYQYMNDVNAIERTIRRIVRDTVDYIVKERYRESHANW